MRSEQKEHKRCSVQLDLRLHVIHVNLLQQHLLRVLVGNVPNHECGARLDALHHLHSYIRCEGEGERESEKGRHL